MVVIESKGKEVVILSKSTEMLLLLTVSLNPFLERNQVSWHSHQIVGDRLAPGNASIRLNFGLGALKVDMSNLKSRIRGNTSRAIHCRAIQTVTDSFVHTCTNVPSPR